MHHVRSGRWLLLKAECASERERDRGREEERARERVRERACMCACVCACACGTGSPPRRPSPLQSQLVLPPFARLLLGTFPLPSPFSYTFNFYRVGHYLPCGTTLSLENKQTNKTCFCREQNGLNQRRRHPPPKCGYSHPRRGGHRRVEDASFPSAGK